MFVEKLPKEASNFILQNKNGIYFEEAILVNEKFDVYVESIVGIEGEDYMSNIELFMDALFKEYPSFNLYNKYDLKFNDLIIVAIEAGGLPIFICANIDSPHYGQIFFENYELEIFTLIAKDFEDLLSKLGS